MVFCKNNDLQKVTMVFCKNNNLQKVTMVFCKNNDLWYREHFSLKIRRICYTVGACIHKCYHIRKFH